MKLIRELSEEVTYLEEADASGKKSLFIEGILMQAEVKNGNGRRYPIGVLEREVDRYVRESVNRNKAYGELGHPQGPTINLPLVSHMFKSIRREGNNFIGKAKIVDTPMGNIVRNLIGEGANLGVSSRGLGTLKPAKDGVMEVQSDFHLASAADIVADPSAPDAFVRGILEGVEWSMSEDGQWVAEKREAIRNDLRRMTTAEIEEKRISVFESFVRSLLKR